jgi:hypothetical protein
VDDRKGMAQRTLETARKPCPLGSNLALWTSPKADRSSGDNETRR